MNALLFRLARIPARITFLLTTMFRLLSALVLGVVLAQAKAAPQLFPLASPAAAESSAPQLVTGTDGEVWMSWVEKRDTGHRLLCSRFDAVHSSWSEPQEIARGADWTVSWADTPQLAAGADGHLAAIWYVGNPKPAHAHHGSYRAWYSTSMDGGATWTEAAPVSPQSNYNEFASIVPLGAGRWMMVWLDGRAKHATESGATQLYARVLGDNSEETRIDERVCDCCPTGMATLPDGSVYVIYRDRSLDEVRDLGGMRWREGKWTVARGLPADGWKIAGCPVNGPALTQAGSRLGAVWFTAVKDQPQVRGSISTDFAVQWTMPQTLDHGTEPVGRADAVLLPGDSLWSSWVQADGSIAVAQWIAGTQPKPVLAVTAPIDSDGAQEPSSGIVDRRHRAIGLPRLAWVARAPGITQRLLLAYTSQTEAGATQVETTLLTLPPDRTAVGSANEDCGCDQNQVAEGHPVRGRVIRVLPERQSVLLAHEEVPGVMRAMTMAFKVDPRLLEFMQADQSITGRIARRDRGEWWLFNVAIEDGR